MQKEILDISLKINDLRLSAMVFQAKFAEALKRKIQLCEV
jgi:hypothetical protein